MFKINIITILVTKNILIWINVLLYFFNCFINSGVVQLTIFFSVYSRLIFHLFGLRLIREHSPDKKFHYRYKSFVQNFRTSSSLNYKTNTCKLLSPLIENFLAWYCAWLYESSPFYFAEQLVINMYITTILYSNTIISRRTIIQLINFVIIVW